MTKDIASGPDKSAREPFADNEDFVTFTIAEQLFGVPVLRVQDVLRMRSITCIPLAPDEISGSLNLRGRIVTAVDVRLRLGLAPRDGKSQSMSIVVEHESELYSLVVDSVGEVLGVAPGDYERNPPTLDARIREYSDGIYRLENELLVVLNVSRLLSYGRTKAA